MFGRKRGRPRVSMRKDIWVSTRISGEDLTKLEYIIEKTGMTKSEILLAAIRMYYNLVVYKD